MSEATTYTAVGRVMWKWLAVYHVTTDDGSIEAGGSRTFLTRRRAEQWADRTVAALTGEGDDE